MNRRWIFAVVGLAAALLLLNAPQVSARSSEHGPTPGRPLVLAHYYIWFDTTSWERAKSDLPLAGAYSSDDPAVVRHHIGLAKAAGIDGFIVSWKSNDRLNARLDQLVHIAEEMDFKLAITYQGLDFSRDPLPLETVAADLDVFIQRWSASPVFDLFAHPLVVWTGTWEHSAEAIASVTGPRRDRLTILASEKNVTGYNRVAAAVDGNLYYWSSVNPTSNGGYAQKLADMANAVRARGQLWIAPVAPGFDARLVGGVKVVERNGVTTLRDSWNGAVQSLPDAIGVISWNEFSENTHIEPSQNFGSAALEELTRLLSSPSPRVTSMDSSAPEGGTTGAGTARFGALAALGGLVIVAAVAIWHRSRTRLTEAPA